ncbi:MAG: nuclear transport factor 2 family protein [Pseudomonadota bacterium]
MSQKKDNALGLYMEGIRDGHPKEALDKYLGARYTQHSTGVASGKQGFLDFFLPFLERTPDRDIRVVRAIEDGPYVFCHVFQSLNGGAAKWITMDLFDTDTDDRIIEHWDVIAAYTETTASGEDMIGGPTEPQDLHLTQANKALIKEYVKTVLTEGELSRLDTFVTPDLIQHAPNLENGRQALHAALNSGQHPQTEMLFKLVGEGNFVATLSKLNSDDTEWAAFDLYRIENGKIAEHWAASEPILPRAQWGNSGKF